MTTSGPDDTPTQESATQKPAPKRSRAKQNLAAVIILLLTALALWRLWPRGPRVPYNPVEGRLELVSRERIIGWAWDRRHPNGPVEVEISDGVNPPVVVTADKYRADLEKAGKGDGRLCFSFETGKRFKYARTYIVHAKIVGSSVELQNSPQQLVVALQRVEGPATMPSKPAARTTTRAPTRK